MSAPAASIAATNRIAAGGAVGTTAPARPYLVNVQILRFFAAFFVVCGHAVTEAGELAQKQGRAVSLFTPLDWGLGVDVFFVISGFIMYYLTVDKFGVRGASSQFMQRRLIRIVPLYWICTSAFLLVSLLAPGQLNGGRPTLLDALLSYLFIPWPRYDGQVFPVFSLGWTLNYEMLFYVSLALCLFLPRRAGLAVLTVFLCGLVLVAAVSPPSAWFIQFIGYPMVVEFLLGVGLAALWRNGARVSIPIAALMIAAGLAIAVWLYQVGAYVYWWRLLTGGIPAILIASAVILAPPAPRVRVASLLAFLGDASYSIYLTHPFAIKAVSFVVAKMDLSIYLVLPIGIPAALVVGSAVHLVVERPLLWLLSSRAKAAI